MAIAVALLLLSCSAVTREKDKHKGQKNQKMSYETLIGGTFIPDFSYAGYNNGLSEVPPATGVVLNVADFGAQANDALDDSIAIQRAFDAANEVIGPVIVRFDSGVYRVTSVLKITRSDFVLQGQGAGVDGTQLHFPAPCDTLIHRAHSTSFILTSDA